MKELETGSFGTKLFPPVPESIRVISWNINRGLELDQVIDFLAGSSADLILLQEVDVNAHRTGCRNVPREIAQALEMNYIFGREFEELGQGEPASPAYHGQAILSHFRLSNVRILRFHRQSGFWRPRWFLPSLKSLQRRVGGRIALICDTTVHGKKLVIYNAHLESRGKDELRTVQLSEMLADFQRSSSGAPALLAGDFNFDLSRGPVSGLISGMKLDSPFARPGPRPTVRNSRRANCAAIDWILCGKGLVGGNPEVHDSIRASDHFPLSLQVSLE